MEDHKSRCKQVAKNSSAKNSPTLVIGSHDSVSHKERIIGPRERKEDILRPSIERLVVVNEHEAEERPRAALVSAQEQHQVVCVSPPFIALHKNSKADAVPQYDYETYFHYNQLIDAPVPSKNDGLDPRK
jgi:hypothetical protein